MRHRLVLLPVLLATLVCVSPAHAWTWPQDGPVLQPFVLGGDPYAAGQHRGIDVAGPPGAPVHAPTAGTVSFAGFVPSGGRTVTIQTEDGLAVTLLHLGSLDVVRGATVAEGGTVGTLALDGDADHPVPYVQMGVRVAADPQGYLDPLVFLPARVPAAEPSAPAGEPAADPAAELPADPQASMPDVGAAPPDPPVVAAAPVAPAAPSGVAVPAHAGGSTVETPASLLGPTNSSESAPHEAETFHAAAPAAAKSQVVASGSAESAPTATTSPPADRLPAEPDAATAKAGSVAVRSAARDPGEFPAGLAAAMAVLGLVTAALVLGRLRWRDAQTHVPARGAPGLQAIVHAMPEPPEPVRTPLPGAGSPERRLARSGPHADSPVAALVRRTRRRRRKALHAA
jgi:hypothetical protein